MTAPAKEKLSYNSSDNEKGKDSSIPRVISLLASATEIVCALGQNHTLVGRSHECDYPSVVKKLPILTGPNVDVTGSSREIDQNIKSHLQKGLSIYRVNSELIEKLRPDVILTQSHCEACAVSQKDIEKALCEKIGADLKIVSLTPNSLSDIIGGIQEIADALGVSSRGKQLISNLKKKMETVQNKAKNSSHRPTVICVEWMDPLMVSGNWIPELVEMAGGENLLGEAGKHSPTLSWTELIQKNPDFLFIMPCGFDLQRTRAEMAVFYDKEGWLDLKCVQNNQVYLLDGNQFFNRPGPRLVESLEIMAEILHPDLFEMSYQGAAWEYAGVA